MVIKKISKHLPREKSYTALLLSGSAVLLLLAALFLGEGATKNLVTINGIAPQSQTASWASCFFGSCDSGPALPPAYACSLSAPAFFIPGQSITISWSANYAVHSILQDAYGWTSSAPDNTYGGSTSYTPPGTDSFALCQMKQNIVYSCACHSGSSTPAPYPTQYISASPPSIAYGAATIINVAAYPGAGFDACQVGGGPWGGGAGVGTSGSFGTGPLYTDTQFWYRCYDAYYGWIPPVYTTVSVASNAPVQADFAPVSSTVTVGQSATLMYYAQSSSPPTQCEVNGNGNTSVAVNVSSCTIAENKSYTTPVYTTPGTYDYYFYYYRNGWIYVKPLYITVTAACPNGTGAAGSCTACNAGYTLSGGNCVLTPTDICTDISGTQATTPTGCQVPVPSPGACIPSGYIYNGTQCVLAPPTISSFSASPTRVRKNVATNVIFSYLVTNPGASCTISGPSGFTPLTINPTSAVVGTRTASVTIPQVSNFTLTCGAASAQTKINLIPLTQEL